LTDALHRDYQNPLRSPQIHDGVRRSHEESKHFSVSIIVVHYGSPDDLQECLDSLLTYSRDAEIIVVDNDDLPAEFMSAFPGVKLFRSLGNVGFGSACNRGARLSKGSVLVFMNNDVIVGPGWLHELLAPLSDPAVGAACPLVLFRDRPNLVNAAGGDSDLLAFAWNRNLLWPRDSLSQGPLFYAPGSCFAVKTGAFRKVGGFDEFLFLFLEDVDLSWRMRLAGWEIALASESVVFHKWMASTSKLTPSDIQYLFNRNRLRLILKNYGNTKLLEIVPMYLSLQIGLLLWIMTRRQGLELRAVLAAWLWNLRNLSHTIRARLRAQHLRAKSDSEIIRYMYRGVAGVHLALGTMKHPVFESYFNRSNREPR